MIFSEPLSQYEEILKDAIRTSMKESGAKLAKTPHIGRFWSGCAGAVKHGLEIMGIGLLDVAILSNIFYLFVFLITCNFLNCRMLTFLESPFYGESYIWKCGGIIIGSLK
ncbi:hypothetical protein SAMN05444364_10599 [Prevotella scopos JCM 17725]|uniref:Uncharacterized protein n=1 Tax=Prevotella scopos JCM 17725 TaxID=1236518 RepID=A0AAX2F298_9BACT|nr:hypothetical protein SAMN05444364_10599 [Prevotella scopos JCM 17725]